MSRIAEFLAAYRFLISCLLAIVGGLAIFFGYRLFASGAGLLQAIDKLNIKNKQFNVSIAGMSAGGALMLTSVFWGYWSYSSIPRLRIAEGNVEIAQPAPKPDGPVFVSAQRPDQLLASRFRGTDVVGAQNEKIGDVVDILFDKDGKVDAYVVSLGGFLGMGSKEVALNVQAVQVVSGDLNSPDRSPMLKVGLAKDQLKQAADFRPYPSAERTATGGGDKAQ
jgi:hypothetical protein